MMRTYELEKISKPQPIRGDCSVARESCQSLELTLDSSIRRLAHHLLMTLAASSPDSWKGRMLTLTPSSMSGA
jgi:hypothetical protein